VINRPQALLALATIPFLSGCVAALLPLAAVGAIGKGEIDRAKAKRELVAAGAVDLTTASVTVEHDDGAPPPALEGSNYDGRGEGFDSVEIDLDDDPNSSFSRFFKSAGPDTSPFAGFAAHALKQSERLDAGEAVSSVVLIPRVDIFAPKMMGCAGKPLAVVIDLDDERQKNWINATTLYRQNGLAEALRSLRAAKISVIWVSEEPVAASETVSAILSEGGLVEGNADDFLFLDRGGDDRKQARRWDAARNYCIVAMAGDKRSDFDELYDYLRNPEGAISLDHMFENGWFITPPPLVVASESSAMNTVEKEE